MSDVIAKRRIFSEARRKLKHIRAAVNGVKSISSSLSESSRQDGNRELNEAVDGPAKARKNWELLKQACHAIVACSKETMVARRAVTLFVENAREQTVTLEERKFEVNKLQALCEALNKMPDPEGELEDAPARNRSRRRRTVIMEVAEAAASLEANSLTQSIPDVEAMMQKLHRLQVEFQELEVEGTAVTAMEEALDGVRTILDIAKAEADASPTTKAKLEVKRQETWKYLVKDVEVKKALPRKRVPSEEVENDDDEEPISPRRLSRTAELMQALLQADDEDGDEEEAKVPWSASSASTSCPTATPPWSAAETALSWSTLAGSEVEDFPELPPSSPGVRREKLPTLPETEEDADTMSPVPSKPSAAAPRRLRRRRKPLGPLIHRRLERRSIASIHMRRAGGQSLEAVVSWRQHHGFRDETPRLSDLWSKHGDLVQIHSPKLCICVACLSSSQSKPAPSASATMSEKSQASYRSVRYRCAVQRWKSWRLLHSRSELSS